MRVLRFSEKETHPKAAPSSCGRLFFFFWRAQVGLPVLFASAGGDGA